MRQPEKANLFSIVRRPEGLFVYTSGVDSDGTFELKCTPLERVTHTLCPCKTKLQESWRRLSDVREADAETLYHVLVVAIETVPDFSAVETLPRLPAGWGDGPVVIRATSAHPRAFKGTKYRPPKRTGSEPIDIRPHLCDRSSLHRLISPMRAHFEKVRHRLKKSGYSEAVIAMIEQELPWLVNSQGSAARNCWAMPARFVRFAWPTVRRQTAREISECLSMYAALDLEHDERVLAAVAHLLVLSQGRHACAWCGIAAVLPADRRLEFIRAVIDTGAYLNQPEESAAATLGAISEMTGDDQFSSWAKHFLVKARDGVSPDYLMSGVRLSAQFSPRMTFTEVGRCENFPEQVVEQIGIELADYSYGGWLPPTLWARCGRFPGMAELLRQSAWRTFAPEAAARYFRFLSNLEYSDLKERSLQQKWRSIQKYVSQVETVLADVPQTHQLKATEYFSEWLEAWDDPEVIEGRLPAGLDLIRRLASAPFGVGGGAGCAVGCLLEIKDKAILARFLSASNRSFEVLDRACRRQNHANLISWGLRSLAQHLPTFTVDAFRTAPGKLLRTARTLGGVQPSVRAEVCHKCGSDPLFRLDVATMPIRDTCSTIAAACGEGYTNPIPARLKVWLRGEIELSDDSLERFRHVMASKIVFMRLDVMESAVIGRLKAGFPVEALSKSGRHALRLLGDVRENRRGLRNFLQAYWSGDGDYLAKHPATLAWYSKHKSIPRRVWEQGIPFEREEGGFTIAVERDPLEILRLGTYTGTCLSIGGMFSDSAIAALLDANKKVVYARDRRGRVIARQLLAIADDERLVCFHVYPLSSPGFVKDAFRDYDREFARALGVPLYEPKGDDDLGYQVSSVLSVYWWDDGSWDLDTPL